VKKAGAKPPSTSVKDVVGQIKTALALHWIPHIYRNQVLTARTRRYEFHAPVRQGPVEIGYTLLGIELKIGRHRLLIPDWATARYLSIFARLGVEAVAVPYDITKVSSLADELESAWQRMMMLAEHRTRGRTLRFTNLVKSHLIGEIRESITAMGAGEKYPAFDTSTKVYRRRVPPAPEESGHE
jgi:hypothetical protein